MYAQRPRCLVYRRQHLAFECDVHNAHWIIDALGNRPSIEGDGAIPTQYQLRRCIPIRDTLPDAMRQYNLCL